MKDRIHNFKLFVQSISQHTLHELFKLTSYTGFESLHALNFLQQPFIVVTGDARIPQQRMQQFITLPVLTFGPAYHHCPLVN